MAEISGNNTNLTHVRVVAHTAGPMGPNTPMSENHWSIYLMIDNGTSVRMNMMADPGVRKGRLVWSILQYQHSTSTLKSWDFPVVQHVEVHHVYELIIHKGRDQYWMSGGGSGCRYWV
jgi:hypothetical protein